MKLFVTWGKKRRGREHLGERIRSGTWDASGTLGKSGRVTSFSSASRDACRLQKAGDASRAIPRLMRSVYLRTTGASATVMTATCGTMSLSRRCGRYY